MVGRTIRRNGQRNSGDKIKVIDLTGFDSGNDSVEVSGQITEARSENVGTVGESSEDNFSPESIDPATIEGNSEPTKRRGRKPGTKNKPKVAAFQAGNLEKLLLSGHAMLAAITKCPELLIDGKDAALLAEGIADVNAAYGLDAMIDPKIMAVVNLTFIASAIYGPRLLLISSRVKRAKPIDIRPIKNTQEGDSVQ